MKRLWWVLLGVVVVTGLTIAGVLAVVLSKPAIPSSIQQQLTTALLVPSGGSARVKRGSAKYDGPNKLLTFTVAYAGTTLVLSEQPTPEQFSDVPEAYTKLVDELNSYQSFTAPLGAVYLTTPTGLGGKQAAVMNAKGTLLFAKPNRSLSNDNWKQFFLHLDVST